MTLHVGKVLPALTAELHVPDVTVRRVVGLKAVVRIRAVVRWAGWAGGARIIARETAAFSIGGTNNISGRKEYGTMRTFTWRAAVAAACIFNAAGLLPAQNNATRAPGRILSYQRLGQQDTVFVSDSADGIKDKSLKFSVPADPLTPGASAPAPPADSEANGKSDSPPTAPGGAPACSTCNSGACSTCGSQCSGDCGCGDDSCDCCDDGCRDYKFGTLHGLLDPCCKLGTQWKLIDHLPRAKCREWNIAGWINQSYTWNPQNPTDRFNGPVTWTDRSNEYQLNQAYIYAEKATKSDGEWDLGGRADLLGGTDHRFTTESGLETRDQFANPKWSTQRFYGLAATQFYGEVAKGDVKTKIGHFYSPVGYEVVPTTGNFFTTLPYTFQYGEPFTHTGVLATWKASDKASLGGGLHRGWDNFDNTNPNVGALSTYTRSFDDKSSLAIVQVYSNEPNQNLGFSSRFLQTNVYSKPLDDQWTYVGQSDFGVQGNALLDGKTARWYGLNQYLFYKISDCWTWGTRAEWFRDEEGFRVGGFQGVTPSGSFRGLPAGPGTPANLIRYGYAGNHYEITSGANWKPHANVTVRPNVRWDVFEGKIDRAVNTAGLRPYDDGTKNWQVLLGFDVITLF